MLHVAKTNLTASNRQFQDEIPLKKNITKKTTTPPPKKNKQAPSSG